MKNIFQNVEPKSLVQRSCLYFLHISKSLGIEFWNFSFIKKGKRKALFFFPQQQDSQGSKSGCKQPITRISLSIFGNISAFVDRLYKPIDFGAKFSYSLFFKFILLPTNLVEKTSSSCLTLVIPLPKQFQWLPVLSLVILISLITKSRETLGGIFGGPIGGFVGAAAGNIVGQAVNAIVDAIF